MLECSYERGFDRVNVGLGQYTPSVYWAERTGIDSYDWGNLVGKPRRVRKRPASRALTPTKFL